jgi:hypothetical protein
MIDKTDRAEINRIIRECREDDARMTPGPWVTNADILYHESEDDGTIALANFLGESMDCEDVAVARVRNNLPAIISTLNGLLFEVDRLAADAERLRADLKERRQVLNEW